MRWAFRLAVDSEGRRPSLGLGASSGRRLLNLLKKPLQKALYLV